MAQLLLQGTNFVNFVGFNAWVGEEGRVTAVQVTEWDEPQAVIGSYLHRYAYPDWYAEHRQRGLRLPVAAPHDTRGPRGLPAAARRVPVRRRRHGRLPRLRRRQHRQQGRLAEDRHRAVLAARPGHHVASTQRHLRRAADEPVDRIRCATRAT